MLAAYDEARLTPVTDVAQLTVEARVETVPPAQQQRNWDFWGSQVAALDLHDPHGELEVTATHPRADAAVGQTCTGESHAWVEVWQSLGVTVAVTRLQ